MSYFRLVYFDLNFSNLTKKLRSAVLLITRGVVTCF